MDLTLIAGLIPDVKIGKIDMDKLGKTVAEIVQTNLEGLIEGAQEDLATFAQGIANDTIKVLQIADDAKRTALMAELVGQLQVIGEINRMRGTQAAWATAGKVVSVIAKTLVKIIAPI